MLGLRSDGEKEQVERERANARRCRFRVGDRDLRSHEEAPTFVSRVASHERLYACAAVIGRRSDLEGEGVLWVVEDEIDLVLAVAPTVETHASVERERTERRSDEVLEQCPELDGGARLVRLLAQSLAVLIARAGAGRQKCSG